MRGFSSFFFAGLHFNGYLILINWMIVNVVQSDTTRNFGVACRSMVREPRRRKWEGRAREREKEKKSKTVTNLNWLEWNTHELRRALRYVISLKMIIFVGKLCSVGIPSYKSVEFMKLCLFRFTQHSLAVAAYSQLIYYDLVFGRVASTVHTHVLLWNSSAMTNDGTMRWVIAQSCAVHSSVAMRWRM